jgi:hypothetical protein
MPAPQTDCSITKRFQISASGYRVLTNTIADGEQNPNVIRVQAARGAKAGKGIPGIQSEVYQFRVTKNLVALERLCLERLPAGAFAVLLATMAIALLILVGLP